MTLQRTQRSGLQGTGSRYPAAHSQPGGSGLINTNYALEAGLNPTDDALGIEGANSPYVNILVVHEDNRDNEALQKLAEALTSEDVRQFIKTEYEGAVVPAF